jgi:hypothetical protein
VKMMLTAFFIVVYVTADSGLQLLCLLLSGGTDLDEFGMGLLKIVEGILT